MRNLASRLWREESGQDLTEYALLVVLIALASIAAVNNIATAIGKVFNQASTNLATT